MVKAGDEMVNEVTGLRTVFRKTAEDTGGELLQVDWIGDPGWTAGPRHVHPKQVERFTVVSGTLGVHVDGAEDVYGPGEVAEAPAGSAHTAWNAGDERVHALVEFEPALRAEVPLESLAGLARDGKVNGAGVPRTRSGWRSSYATTRTSSTSPAPLFSCSGRSSARSPLSGGCSATGPSTPTRAPRGGRGP
jgi:quercetin dioxygenase-like cupin family protein